MKSLVFKTAWSYIKNNIFTTLSDALKAAWKAVKLRMALKVGKVEVTFRKASGEITTRTATLCSDFFEYTNKGTNRVPKPSVISFYSLTDNGFRACRIERLISYNPI